MLIRTNLYIALGAAAWTAAAAPQLGHAPRALGALPLCVFGATWAVYCLDRLSPWSVEDAPVSQRRAAELAAGLIAGSLIAIATVTQLPLRLAALCAPLTAITLGYALPLLPTPQGPRRLKELPGAKVFMIALTWALVTAGLPALLLRAQPQLAASLIAERALFTLAITLPFDVRDMDQDARAHILTLPQLLGLARTRSLCLTLLAAAALIATLTRGIEPGPLAAYGITAALLAALRQDRPALYYAGLLDGAIILHAALTLVR